MSAAAEFAREVVRLHAFFEAWFAGSTDRSITEFADALAPDFVAVPPSGEVLQRTVIVDRVRAAYGSGAIEIRIEDPTVRVDGPVVIGTYEEHQRSASSSTARVSTAAMTHCDDAPGGWSWLIVHETWMPGRGPDDQVRTSPSK